MVTQPVYPSLLTVDIPCCLLALSIKVGDDHHWNAVLCARACSASSSYFCDKVQHLQY